ncbi:hypothetical protein [Amycolatopsis sp. Poz14]|uniref:hypothetical protein n=1 Tax=Amycolatopsis sp. Poz14 TaxID=1447705 RepID=UPI001EE9525C|nr:hypothetical protein [Amycolatopsis sp. Poz14]MCG3751704.1 hypothetical protein [Amycolatopsis sp. Poz14]
MTFEGDWAEKTATANQRFADKAVEIAREVEVLLGREAMTYPRHPVARAREALADRVFALLAAARDASQTFYNVDQVPVAIVSDGYGDDWVEKVADAAGTLAAAMARAATVLTGVVGGEFKDADTKQWFTGVLDDVRNAAAEVLREAASRPDQAT